jgi:hypothetical protein
MKPLREGKLYPRKSDSDEIEIIDRAMNPSEFWTRVGVVGFVALVIPALCVATAVYIWTLK